MLKTNEAAAERCGITAWHRKGYTGKGVKIAVIDSKSRYVYDYQDYIVRPFPNSGGNDYHGAQCCEVIHQFAPDAELWLFPNNAEARQFIRDNDFDIISCSFVGGKNADLQKLAQQTLMVAAAGNNYDSDDGADRVYPSSYPETVTVGAVTQKGDRAKYSNGGECLDCLGHTDISMLNDSGNEFKFNGTSCAAPFVAAQLALVTQAAGRLTWQQAKEYVHAHCEDYGKVGRDNESGYGIFVLPEPQEAESMDYQYINFPFVDARRCRITNIYGAVNPSYNSGRHDGVDIVSDGDKTVIAISDGMVIRSGVLDSWGEYIVVQMADGRSIVYGHLQTASRRVKVGNRVIKGQALGIMGNTGNSSGAHLHIELQRRYYKAGRTDDITVFMNVKNQLGRVEPLMEFKQIQIRLNGVVKTVDAIEKEGHNFVMLQDLRDSKIAIEYDGLPVVRVVSEV